MIKPTDLTLGPTQRKRSPLYKQQKRVFRRKAHCDEDGRGSRYTCEQAGQVCVTTTFLEWPG
jgi:hypothetical protein